MRPLRLLAWAGIAVLVVLGARATAYALSPSPLAPELAHEVGGPELPVVAAVSMGLALAVSVAVVWLAAIGVRERRLLEQRPMSAEPRLRIALLFARAALLSAGTTLGFALLESYVHWRAGLGWHGLGCLTGPVHEDAIPILVSLSLVAAALACALDHALAWMRRKLAATAPRPGPITVVACSSPSVVSAPVGASVGGSIGARAPPAFA